ncbi:hypothetical protein [Neoroseomonas lacus]|uniref:Uncharacterized protein n=1 Tax=Neoroseomonas lacus TaxID=287609 RepID=A0A917L388_9PROT|nr:hypothetical protein [Neoroseomonas lacus]GGJ40672.1 hypothetical protein GCM10011320_55460 [Neoroseomonas lacus]
MIGGNPYWRHYWPQLSEDEILGQIPPEPTFEEALEDVRRSIEQTIRRVSVPKGFDRPPPVVSRILKYDEARLEKAQQYGSLSSWYAPRYESVIQRRRLRMISALFLATSSCGCRAETSGGEPYDGVINDFMVRVGDQSVRVRVTVIETKRRIGKGAEMKTASVEHIRIALDPGDNGRPDGRIWEDGEQRLESQLSEIAVAIVLKGEEQHREGVLRQHAWRIERRAQLIEQRRKEREEAVRRERERIAELERRRVDRLLGEVEALQKAETIRRYVAQVRIANEGIAEPMLSVDLDAWAEWALAQADRIDPVTSGSFRKPWEEEQ